MTTRTPHRPTSPRPAPTRRPARRTVPARAAVLALVAVAVLVSAALALPSVLALVSGRPAPTPRLLAADVLHSSDEARLRETKIDPFDDTHPAIAGLDADLRAAVQAVARDAHDRGVDLWVTSGLRTAALQQDLLDDAVRKHGSLAEARRFVATPEGSSHVTGQAVDIGPTDGADWVVRHGARYGLCQTYANEMWHFELATTAGGECPEQLPDAG
ncbi:M15 family metallopeptidase [Cellulomonas cellasea]|uniref:D-alanyl-D-alanine dipeptidase n=1 Tax=Cellulomonas cellasea TaxID=43670 RepID=A0A7W4UH61_9CELL|nr:M15 family metallopeptidase [Cellulomonas cellasea]MBB2923749.1 D-alanyl-D-alanine dipeptidase [Cellulomonas cellasea]